VAGYTLGWSDFDRLNIFGVFDNRDGKSRLAAVTSFTPRTDMTFEVIPSQIAEEFWFFAYGNRLGKSQLRLNAALYAFNGQGVKLLWETRDVYDGKMRIDRDKVTIRFLKEEEYARELAHRRKPPRYEATYLITPGGLVEIMQKEIPF